MTRITVEHQGISPEDYHRINQHSSSQLEEGRKRRQMESLPALAPVSRPQRIDSSTNPRKVNEAKAVIDAAEINFANINDLKNRGLTK